jgi:Ca2+-binding RTX toxin-like protein
MALTNLHTTGWEHGSYEEDRNYQIKIRENDDLYDSRNSATPENLNAHDDNNHSIAFGYGYDLFQNLNTLVNDLDDYVSAVNTVGTYSTITAALNRVYTLISNNTEIPSGSSRRQMRNNPNYPNIAGNINALINEINSLITLSTEANATNLLNNTLAPIYENRLTNRLATRSIVLPESKERVALFDMVYNGGAGLIGDNLLSALENNNRAEAWYEIRYNSNYGNSRINTGLGIANRRVSESNTFNLYSNNFDNLSNEAKTAESKTIMRMYTLHKSGNGTPYSIENEETSFPAAYNGSNSITSQTEPAKTYLITNFGEGVNIDGDIIVGAGLDSYAYKNETINDASLRGTSDNDLIFGEKGNDTINAGNGDDVIYGGEGNDTLNGGKGNDTYIIEVPNELAHDIEHDIIEETSVTDRIIFKGKDDKTDNINNLTLKFNNATNRNNIIRI